jgi:fatty-acyl-CoA synthase
MQDFPLSLVSLLRHGARVHADSEVAVFDGVACTRTSFAGTAERAARLAHGLSALGIGSGDVVGIFGWNTQEYLDAYFAVPAMGAALHTLNVRLHPEQLAYVVNHAEDKVIIVDASLVPLLATAASKFETVRSYVVIGDAGDTELGPSLSFDELVAARPPDDPWRMVDEHDAAVLCYTTGTTGAPRGVAYSHRSIWLHTMLLCTTDLYGLSEADRVLLTVPMFHGIAMGMPYAGWMTGADLLLPGRHLQPEPLARLIAAERPTWAGAVPVVWNDILRYSQDHDVDLSSLRVLACGGAPVPPSFISDFQQQLGVRIVQGWGMTETDPVAAVNPGPPKHPSADDTAHWVERSGRVVPGVEVRVVDDAGRELPWDGESVGELEVRGPWVAGEYVHDPAPERFHDGWLRTGDVGVMYPKGYLRITDRLKDVIKSGGEWISSAELESQIATHPSVTAAAVVGVPDERWQERPLAVVTCGQPPDFAALRHHLDGRVARFWVPEYWACVAELPRTSVGKLDKRALRDMAAGGDLTIQRVDG